MTAVTVVGFAALAVVIVVVAWELRRLRAAVEQLTIEADERQQRAAELLTDVRDELRELGERAARQALAAGDWARPDPSGDRGRSAPTSAPRIKAAGLATGASVAVRRLRRGA